MSAIKCRGGKLAGGDLPGCSSSGISCPGEQRRGTWPDTGRTGEKISSQLDESVFGNANLEMQTFRLRVFRQGVHSSVYFGQSLGLGKK